MQGVGCKVQGAGHRVQGMECRVQDARCKVPGAGCSAQGIAIPFLLAAWGQGRWRNWLGTCREELSFAQPCLEPSRQRIEPRLQVTVLQETSAWPQQHPPGLQQSP